MEEVNINLLRGLTSKLEKVCEEVLTQQGFTADTEKLLILLELIKEQVPNESTHP